MFTFGVARYVFIAMDSVSARSIGHRLPASAVRLLPARRAELRSRLVGLADSMAAAEQNQARRSDIRDRSNALAQVQLRAMLFARIDSYRGLGPNFATRIDLFGDDPYPVWLRNPRCEPKLPSLRFGTVG